ncbi:hypothetical protein RXV95_15325 [Novosphingobium sp. ZN18A2]|uniref:hypothetical protein n=1 Tax=Novosphingobium sp. ZN18A2 TaxID=3079861 RepID=UPI0030D0E3FB
MEPEDEELPLSGKRWVWVLGSLIVVLVVALMVSMIPRGYNEPVGDPANAAPATMGAMNGTGMNGTGTNGAGMNNDAMNQGAMNQDAMHQGTTGGAPAASPSAAPSTASEPTG